MTEISGELLSSSQSHKNNLGEKTFSGDAKEPFNQAETDREKITIFFLRHAPTQESIDHRVQGGIDTDILQKEAAAYLEKIGVKGLEKPDLVVMSGLKRTQQTADVLKELRGWSDLPTIIDSSFNERSWGIFEGKTHEEIRKMIFEDQSLLDKYSYLKAGEFERIWSDPDFRVEGSESLNELKPKVKAGMIELSKKYPGKKILVITHAGVLQTQECDFNSISGRSVKKNSNGEEVISKN